MSSTLEKIKQYLQKADRKKWHEIGARGLKACSGIFLGYIVASLCSSLVVMFILDDKLFGAKPRGLERAKLPKLGPEINYRDLRLAVMDRNLFNSEGKFPDEADPSEKQEEKTEEFSEDAPCNKSSLSVDLLGTIFLGDRGPSLATIKERGYSQADIYRTGEKIIGNEGAKIHRIERKLVVLNNNGVKECLKLKPPKSRPNNATTDDQLAAQRNNNEPPKPPENNDSGDCSNVSLKESYVTKQLGDGFSKILTAGRLIPENNDSGMIGFKLIGMKKSSLFGKVCLQNGDVITQVNDISMQQPDQGFALYQAFQDEREIRISLLRNGSNPMTINVQVK